MLLLLEEKEGKWTCMSIRLGAKRCNLACRDTIEGQRHPIISATFEHEDSVSPTL